MTDSQALARFLEGVSALDMISLLITLGVIIAGLKWIRPALQPLRDFTILLQGRPGFPGVPAIPPFSERLAAVEKASQEAAFHSQPNHGTSAYDGLMGEIKALRDQVMAHVELSSDDRATLHAEFDAHLTDVPALLARAFAEHCPTDCPHLPRDLFPPHREDT